MYVKYSRDSDPDSDGSDLPVQVQSVLFSLPLQYAIMIRSFFRNSSRFFLGNPFLSIFYRAKKIKCDLSLSMDRLHLHFMLPRLCKIV